jgi:hypothetical protein
MERRTIMDAPGVVDCSFLAPPEGVPISAVTVEMRIPALSAFVIIKKKASVKAITSNHLGSS